MQNLRSKTVFFRGHKRVPLINAKEHNKILTFDALKYRYPHRTTESVFTWLL